MNIAVISDLHLGARPKTDLFGHDDHEFLRFLKHLESSFEKIVLLGDIWETLMPSSPGAYAEELRLARKRHREIAQRFRSPQYVYVHGNHDLCAAEIDGAPAEHQLTVGGTRLLFTHGHQSDELVTKARCLSEAGVWLGGWLRRAGLDAAWKFFDKLDQMRGAYHSTEVPSAVEAWAVARARALEADIVVTGHTHVARHTEHGSQVFLNSGTCTQGAISFLALSPKQGSFQVASGF